MRSYENLQYAFQQLELAAAYYAAGKLDDFIRNTGSLLTGDEDFLYQGIPSPTFDTSKPNDCPTLSIPPVP